MKHIEYKSVAISRGNAAQEATTRTSHTNRNGKRTRNSLQMDDISLLHREEQQFNKEQHVHKDDNTDSNNNKYIHVRIYVLVSYIRDVPHNYIYIYIHICICIFLMV